MPDVAVHAAFGKEVFSALSPEVRSVILPEPWTFGLFGPDLWFMHRPWRRREGRGRQMHTTRTGAFLLALLRRAREAGCSEGLFSWLAGFLCHYALDSTAHPYIIYLTTEEYRFPRSHMSLEHALDLRQMERDGFLGEKHPVTDHYFPPVQLPAALEPEVDAVFEEVYGWKRCRRAMNRSARLYRRCYRVLENPRGVAAGIARLTKSQLLRSLAYSESQFRSMDAENEAHRPWRHSHDSTLTCTESFPELRERAKALAVRLIEAAWRHIRYGEGSPEEMAALFGSNSYLSGLPEDDGRNHSVGSLLPSGAGKGKKPKGEKN